MPVAAPVEARSLFGQRSFLALLAGQFLGALNDNILRFLSIFFILSHPRLAQEKDFYIALSGALFILPYLLFSAFAGQWTDRHPKDRVLRIAKAWEVPNMALAALGLILGKEELLFAALFGTGIQATFFGPAKYAILPELAKNADLGRANALINGTTFLGILSGALLGGILADYASPWQSGMTMILLAVLGLLCLFALEPMPAPASVIAFSRNPFSAIGQLWQAGRHHRAIFPAIFLISYLWFLGALLQLLLPVFGLTELSLSATSAQSLLIFIALGISMGCLSAGRREARFLFLAKIGLLGVVLASFWIGWGPKNYGAIAGGLFLLGYGAGLYLVPLYALLQRSAPASERGRIIALNNFINTIGILAASLALYIAGTVLEFQPSSTLLLAGLASLLALGGLITQETVLAGSVPRDDVRDRTEE